MIIIFGSRASHIYEAPVQETCTNCGTPNSIRAVVYQKYAHIFWAPLFPIGKTGALYCAQCKYAVHEERLNPEFKRIFQKAETQAKTPLWTWAALMAIGALVLIIVIINVISAIIHSI